MNWIGLRVLVTGGAGVVGSYVTERMVASGARVTVADNLSRGRLENLRSVGDVIRRVDCDLIDESAARAACEGQDVLIHLAARVAGIDYNRSHNADMLRINVTLTGQVLEAAAAEGVGRCLLASSACVYPQDAVVPTPETEGARGDPEPDNEGYGWAKRIAERLAIYYERERGMQVRIVRPFNIFSPRDPFAASSTHVIPALIARLYTGEDPLTVWGSGNQTRSFLHAADLASAIRYVLELESDPGPVNVGSNREVTMAELIELLFDATGIRRAIRFDMSRPEGQLRRVPDLSKIAALTHWEPAISLEQGLLETATAFGAWWRERDRAG